MQKLVVDASKKSSFNIQELVRYKDLFWTLTYRDFKVRYAQATLGLFWAFLQPFATLMVLLLVFGKALNVKTDNVPYPLFAMAGMVLWTYFSYVINQASTSIVSAQSIITKIYFPKLIIPFSKAIVGFIDFLISLAILIALFFWYAYTPSANIMWAPLFVILSLVASLGIGVFFSALTVRFRDFQYVIPFMVQFGLYITPVAYPASSISQNFRLFYYLNPMAGAIEGFRWSLFGGTFDTTCYWSYLIAVAIFVIAIIFFGKIEEKMADIV